MKRMGWKAVSLFVLTFVTTLVVNTPATLLAKLAEGASSGQFVLANAAGTIWRGEARPAIRQRNGSMLVLEKLHWEIALWPLFTGKIITRLEWDNIAQAQPMLVTITFDQIELRNTVIPLDAAILGGVSSVLQPAQLSGQMQIRSEQFTFTRQGFAGNAVADWLNAGSAMSTVNPLGSYRINLAGAGESLDVSLMTLSGVLLLDGKGRVTRNQGVNFQLTARAASSSNGKLDELINNFGPETSPGVHTLTLLR